MSRVVTRTVAEPRDLNIVVKTVVERIGAVGRLHVRDGDPLQRLSIVRGDRSYLGDLVR